MMARRAALAMWLAAVLAGCATSPAARPAGVDAAAALVGGWTGEWRSSVRTGHASLEIYSVTDSVADGRLSLDRYADDVTAGGQLVKGAVRVEGDRLRLSLADASPSLDLEVRGTRMRGTSPPAATPSRTIAVTLEKIR